MTAQLSAFPAALALLGVLLPPGAAEAQGPHRLLEGLRAGGKTTLRNDPTCSDGIVYDDSSFETGYGYGPAVEVAEFVMRFDVAAQATLEGVCVCFTREPGNASDLDFGVVVFDDDGSQSSPGTFLGSSEALVALDVPVFPDVGIYRVPDLALQTDGRVFVGATWLPSQDQGFFLCADETGPPVQPGYTAIDQGSWSELSDFVDFANYAALGVRAELRTATEVCTPDASTLCLNQNRFRVQVDWRTPTGESGVGQAVSLTQDTGYFWFFNQDNVEMVIKVLDACSFANRFWVFAGGLTNVDVEISVEDTRSGIARSYSNPQNTPFQPIQDTNAFATCP